MVTIIGTYTFAGCINLVSPHLPPSIKVICQHAFDGCSNMNEVSMPSVTEILEYAFNNCTTLPAITLPSSISSISSGAFTNCINLNSITLESLSPLEYVSDDVFSGVNKTTCKLQIPYGTKDRYISANVWKNFTNIVEGEHGFLIKTNLLKFGVTGGRNSMLSISANIEWMAESDNSWLIVTPTSGNDSQMLTVTVNANETVGARKGLITFSAPGFPTQTLKVIQDSPMKTVTIIPGGLKDALTNEEKATISNLTIKGTMDATDFGTMSREMPMLTKLDLSEVSIVSYKEINPDCRFEVSYPANTLPGMAPYCPSYTLKPLDSIILPNTLTTLGWHSLAYSHISSIVIPSSVTTIENETFYACKELQNIVVPSSVTKLGLQAFAGCSSLRSIDLPSTLDFIEDNTFLDCINLNSIKIPPSVISMGRGVFYGCSSLKEIFLPPSLTNIGYEAFGNCSDLTSVIIPSSVTEIDGFAFVNCTNLQTVSIPSSVKNILPSIFNKCTSLSSIYIYKPIPTGIGPDNPWYGVDRSTCTLYVPFGSAKLYAAAPDWKEFSHIIEMAEFRLLPSSVTFESEQGTNEIALTTDVEWTVTSDKPWLKVSPSLGSKSTSITLTAEANSSVNKRIARISFSISGNTFPDIIVMQKGVPLTIELTAGNLSYEFPTAELRTVNHLTIIGTMDARDFKFIRDELPYLIELDLREATILAYSGKEGTIIPGYYYPDIYPDMDYEYMENSIPSMAFMDKKTNITAIKLPTSLTSIGNYAFSRCERLEVLDIPSTVTSIGKYAFSTCMALKKIELPTGLTTIEPGLFDFCIELQSIVISPSVTSVGNDAFSACQSLTSIEIPSSVTSIGQNAFLACYNLRSVILPVTLDSIKEETFSSTGLTSIRIPASVRYIGKRAFFSCGLLMDFYAYPVIPPDLTKTPEVFYYLDQSKCTLYVPKGSKALYASADQWKDFTHIVEMIPFTLSDSELSVEALPEAQSLQIITDRAWNAACNNEWLTVIPMSGDSSQTVTFTCMENTAYEPRTASVVFSDGNGYSQTVHVTQEARINNIPIANAGEDQIVVEGELVQLDGSASTDADNDPLTYHWTAPEGIDLNTVSDARSSFMAPKVNKDTICIFNLVVNDGKGNSAPDQVFIAIRNKTVELDLSVDSVVFESMASSAKIFITGNAQWKINKSEDWLTVSPVSGEGQKEITITALANEEVTDRIATITISAPEVDTKTISVVQHALITGVVKITSAIKITCYPTPFTDHLTIELLNPSNREISIDIYNISGQKVRGLLNAKKEAKIDCIWDGRDENGKQIPNGIYLLRVNGEMKKVVKR